MPDPLFTNSKPAQWEYLPVGEFLIGNLLCSGDVLQHFNNWRMVAELKKLVGA